MSESAEAVGPSRLRPLLTREHMPTDFEISIEGGGGADRILHGPRRNRRQSMRGFEDTYEDIVDYILRITYRIWEDKDAEYINATYADPGHIVGSSGLKVNRDQILAETRQYLAMFPDIRLLADEMIWAGDDEVGFRTSHRLWDLGTHTGPSEFGEPTGRQTASWTIANCVVVENEIVEEWVLDNTLHLIQQLGLDAVEVARSTANSTDLGPLLARHREIEEGAARASAPPEVSRGGAFDVDATVRAGFHGIFNDQDLARVDEVYADNVRYHGATGCELHGREAIKAEVAAYLTMFPDLARVIDEIYWQGNDHEGYLASVRWSAVGTHRGAGRYGAPTDRRVSFWGISQLTLRNGRVTDEWTMFTDFELLQLIVRDEPLL